MKAGMGSPSLSELTATVGSFLGQTVELGKELFQSLAEGPLSSVSDAFQRSAKRTLMGCGTCDIPPPCWMPQPLGRLVSHVCPGGTATIRFRVTNCDIVSRTVSLEASGTQDAITFDPGSATLGPLEEATLKASLALPGDAVKGDSHGGLLWVRGCRDHDLRWTVKVGTGGCDSLHEVEVEDCPDYLHHWYDHFYCRRPCIHQTPQRDPSYA